MWQCPDCEYMNDDPADACERCQRPRPVQQPPPVAASAPAKRAAVATHPDANTREKRRYSPLEVTALTVILICIAVLTGLAAYAWLHGFNIDSMLNRPPRADSAGSAAVEPQPDASGSLPDDHPLAVIYTTDSRDVKKLRRFADDLLAFEERLPTFNAPELVKGEQPEETSAYLDTLLALGEEMLDSYTVFDAACRQHPDAALAPYQQTLRDVYAGRFADVLLKIGEVYAKDKLAVHTAYGLSDRIPTAVETADAGLADELRETWMVIVGQRQQYLLFKAQHTEYLQLKALMDSLRELHSSFQASLNEIPPYRMRNGLLDKSANDVLDLLETLATSIETLVLESAEYTATLDTALLSNINLDLIKDFDELAQQDHLYAFSEAYRIYAQDRELEHPAYARLADHFAFAEEHWPQQEMTYRRIYSQYENEWAQMFER